ncbi:hypothetical protein [Halobellus sp. GM3]|uniref:hypothetical protein n=1 Tax=Halobellus sp. GM3 TaxID=3458410 RepID=UPI00403DF39A
MSKQQEEAGHPLNELPDQQAVDWTIVQSLLAANEATSRALESHLLQAYYEQDGNAETESTAQYLERAVTRHERIIEDLRFARELLEER